MKKRFILIYLFFSVAFLSAESINFFSTNTYMNIPYYLYIEFDKSSFTNFYQGLDKKKYERGIEFPYFIETSDFLYLYDISHYNRLNKNKIKVNDDGFQYFLYRGNIQYIIFGGDYYTVKYNNFFKNEDSRINEIGEIFHKVFTSKNFDHNTGEFVSTDKKLEDDWGYWASRYLDYSMFFYNIIKSIKMNVPYLRETLNGNEILYDDDILKYRWFVLFDCYGTVYANCTKPMVESDPGNGTGVVIDIDFVLPSDNLVVLNGYADWNKQHLYKQNARMKTVLVEGDGFSFEYTFEDYVHFAQINFPKAVEKIKLTVKDVYDGEKWSDMAISGLWVNPDVTHTANSKIAKEYLEYAEQHCINLEQ